MIKKKVDWDDIPSLDGLEVDWQFEPENPLGKRVWARVDNIKLFQIFGVKNIPVRVVAKDFDSKGYLADIAQGGLAVLLDTKLVEKQLVKVGFFLGKQKILSNAVVRNACDVEGRFRTGIEFVDLGKEYESYIVGLIASSSYKSQG